MLSQLVLFHYTGPSVIFQEAIFGWLLALLESKGSLHTHDKQSELKIVIKF